MLQRNEEITSKKSLLFVIIAISLNVSAQSKHSSSPSMDNFRGRVENTGITTYEIAFRMNLGQVFKHKAHAPGSSIKIFDSTIWWQWDNLSSGWKIIAKGIECLL